MVSFGLYPVRVVRCVGVVGIVFLSACGSQPEPPAPQQPDLSPPKVFSPQPLSPQPVPPQFVPPQFVPLAPPSVPPAPEFDLNPQSYQGRSPQEITQIFGSAVLERTEPPGLLMQFHAGSCILDVVFYDGVSRYLEARDRAVKQVKLERCLESLLRARLGKK